MIFFFAAGAVQSLVVFECLLRRFLSMFLPSQRSQLGRYTDKSVVATGVAGLSQVVALPLQMLATLASVSFSALVATAFLVLLGLVMSENSSTLLALIVRAYNTGVAPVANTLLEFAVMVNGFFRLLLPVYNALVYIPSQLLLKVLGPLVWEYAEALPEILGNLTLCLSALVMSIVQYMKNLVKCSAAEVLPCSNSSACGAQFVEYDLNCFANPAFLSLDVMTPGVYLRRVCFGLQGVLQDTCGVTAFIFNAMVYPLLDFNLYKAIHCLVNLPFFGLVASVLGTLRRCEYLRVMDYSPVEQAVGCTPDFLPLASLVTEMLRALGRLVDNWSNTVAALLLEAVTGTAQTCMAVDVPVTVREATAVFGTGEHRVRVVGLTERTLAVTDGESVVYRGVGVQSWGSFAWPLRVRVQYGVAAVQAHLAADGDDTGESRSGLLGCECLDSPGGIELACATIPLLGNGNDDDLLYNVSTIHNIKFDSVRTDDMTCANTMVRVVPLRFSRRRVASSMGGGRDADQRDPYNTFGGGGAQLTPFAADAAIYVQPLCGDVGARCLPLTDSCYPWCMGLHVAGLGGQNISILNAVRWEQYVSVRQTDCGIELDDGRLECEKASEASVLVQTLRDGVEQPARCGLQTRMCVTNDHVVSSVSVQAYARGNRSLVSQKEATGAVQRTSAQPFAVAGDVMLTVVQGEVVVTRLYDGGGGQFGVAEELTLVRNQRRVRVETCATLDDFECISRVAREGRIVAPVSYFDYMSGQIPAASSEWAVHWAVNPDLGVKSAIYRYCSGGGGDTSVIIESSWSPARVWSMKTMRATDLYDSGEGESAVSYMVVPGFQEALEFKCSEMSSLKVVALEYINSRNVLVTVLEAKPEDVDYLTGDVMEDRVKTYRYYFLNPERQDCVEPREGPGAYFSCWKEGEPWQNEQETALFGRTCPAADRMPLVGSAMAEAATVVVWMLRLLADTLCVIPAAIAGGGWAGISEVMQPRLGRQAFHSMLDSSGAHLFGVEEIIKSINRASLYTANGLVRVANALQGRPGSEVVQHALTGTAKVLQHSDGLVVLGDPISRQLEAIKKLPSMQVLASVGDASTNAAMDLPLGLPSTTRLFVTFSSVLSLNLRIVRRVLVRLVRATDVAGAVSGVLLAAVYESTDDFEAFLDSTRMQCHGLGEILGGSNPWARMLRQACQLGPDAVQFVLQAMRVVFVEYPVMACACRMEEGERESARVSQMCLRRFSPAEQQRWMLSLVFTPENAARRDTCFASMDGANGRLLVAMDPFLSRVYRLAESAAEGLEYLISVFTVDRSGCSAYLLSPYVLSLVPEPVDFFMGCMHTPDCRVKCTAEYTAFDEALLRAQGGGPTPRYEYSTSVSIESNLFDPYDSEENRHLPPFEIFAVLELGAACDTVCSKGVRGRCIAVAGRPDGGGVALRYYCLPADVTMYVFEYESFATGFEVTTESVVDMMVLTGYKVALGRREWVLVIEESDGQTVAVIAVPGMLFRTELFRTAEEEVNQRNGLLQSILAVRVVPAMEKGRPAMVFVEGKKRELNAAGQSVWNRKCLALSVVVDEDDGSMVALEVQTHGCEQEVVSSAQRSVCLNAPCSEELVLPASLSSPSEVVRRSWRQGLNAPGHIDERVDIKGKAASLVRTLGADSTRPMYQMRSRGVRRRAVLSPMTTSTGPTFELIVCNAGGTVVSWIHVVSVRLEGGVAEASSSRTTLTEQRINLQLECSIDNCVGCNNFPDLLAKCYAAQECGVARCAGTIVNMRKPLCSLGQLAAQHLHLFRIAVGGLWQAVAQQVVLFVELSEARRKQYEISWPEESFVAMTCQAKDVAVQLSATFTSVAGAIGLADKTRRENDVSSRNAAVDARAHARFIMTLTATTNLLSSAMLMPVYMLICMRKVVSCSSNDAIALFEDVFGSGDATVTLFIGSKRLNQASESSIGTCLGAHEKEMLRDVGRQQANVVSTVMDLVSGLAQLTTRTLLESAMVVVDAGIAWLIGVVSGMMDVVATADWQHCKLPDISTHNVGQCACGDEAYRIPETRRRENSVDGALWCSGLLLLTGVDGSDVLVWNPYSLGQLLETPGLDTFLACLSDPASTRCEPPEVQTFRQQGVELMQVVSLCRSNYQRSKWDDAAVLYSLFEPQDWRSGRLPVSSLDDQYTKLRLRILALSRSFAMNVNMDDGTWSCLRSALESEDTFHRCHELFIGRRERHFLYERATDNSFRSTDACRVFSGASAERSASGLPFTPYVWSADSSNKVPVALLHDMEEPMSTRLEMARGQLRAVAAQARDLFQRIRPERLNSDLEVVAFSVEGDQVHQLADCVVMGPYAAAEIPPGYVGSEGRRTVASVYHRGSPASRQFEHGVDGATGGSESRKTIIGAAIRHIGKEAMPVVAEAARVNVERLRALFLGTDDGSDIPRNLLCLCANGGESLECCVEYEDRDDIEFGAKYFFDSSLLNLQSSVMEGLLDKLTESDLLNVTIWTSDEFAPPREVIPEADRDVLLAQQLFNLSAGAYAYTREEVRTHTGGRSLWAECMDQLSSSFFTLPLRGDGVDADMAYDPRSEGVGEYLHGMERVVQEVLRRARQDSPVFWSHVHRYVPSDSVWCEDATPPAPSPEAGRAAHPERFMGSFVHTDTILAPSQQQAVFPADLSARCFCGWGEGGVCTLPAAVCQGRASASEVFTAVCGSGRYSTRDELFEVARELAGEPLEAPWRRECLHAKPTTLWGLLDAEQTRAWFEGSQDAPWTVDLHTLATAGPAGLRLAHFGTGNNSMWEYARSNATGVKALNTALKHTVGQPVCRAGLAQALVEDLSGYFRDVFFPMAHTVHEAPVRAACSRWVIEYAIQMALTQVEGADVAKQVATTEVWRTRCEAQLQQIGVCELRGVFDIHPPSAAEPPPDCQLTAIDRQGCEPFFFTPNCLVRCGKDFFDPCACGTEDCRFSASQCESGRLRVRGFADSAQVRLLSLLWPTVMLESEGASMEMEAVLRAIAAETSSVIDFSALYASLVAEMQAAPDEGEGLAPQDPGGGYCDDLFDYWDPSTQHPVGYHPTMGCTDAETNARGFDAWMSADREGRVAIDPVRLRDPALSSTVFGAASLVCDAAVYGADAVYFNDLFFNSRWDPSAKADPAIPGNGPRWVAKDDDETGTPSRDPADTPLLNPDEPLLPHSAGLLRDWLAPGDEGLWPHWAVDWTAQSSAFPDAYGAPEGEAVCAPPSINTCIASGDCAEGLECMRQGTAPGVCMAKGTCFQHSHCPPALMCSGNGACVPPVVTVENGLPQKAAVQVHGRACTDDSPASHFEHVPNFAKAHGLCKFRNWFHMRQLQMKQGVKANDPLLLIDADTWVNLTDQTYDKRLREWVQMSPHVCDRSYQLVAGFGLCRGAEVPGTVAKTGTRATPYSVLNILRGSQTQMCDMRFLPEVTGFLDPYRNYVDGLDTLLMVQTTIRRCWEFKVCPKQALQVQGKLVQRRKVLVASIDAAGSVVRKSSVRDHCAADTERCWGAGYLAGTSCSDAILRGEKRCVVDIFVVPMLWVVFGTHPAPSLISRSELPERLRNLTEHCPSAFVDVQGISAKDRLSDFYTYLAAYYYNTMQESVTDMANDLLLSLFGVSDVTASENVQNNFEEYYFAASRCVAFVLQRLEELHEHFGDKYLFEAQETGIKPLSPGSSMYLILERQPMYVPFDWVWQCAVLGGADKFWMQTISSISMPTCTPFSQLHTEEGNVAGSNFMATIKERLQGDRVIYMQKHSGAVFAERMIKDLDHLISLSIFELQIGETGACKITDLIRRVREIILHGAPSNAVSNEEFSLHWYEYTIHDFLKMKVLKERSIDDLVGAHDNEFPHLVFVSIGMQVDDAEDKCFSHGPVDCSMFSADERDCNIMKSLSIGEMSNVPPLLGLSTAGNLIMRFIDRNMHRMPSFAGSEFNIVPDHENTLRMREFSAPTALQDTWQQTMTYNKFMRDKGFECRDEVDMKQSNMLHQRMSQCVAAMEDTGGWVVDGTSSIRMAVSRDLLEGGFFPTFTQFEQGARWLHESFSDRVTMQMSESESICYVTDLGPRTINPFWAGDFDIETGCDTSVSGGTRYIDVNCRSRGATDSDMYCSPEFSSYENLVKNKMPQHCREQNRDPLVRINMGSLPDSETPLCERTPPSYPTCDRTHGSLHGFQGEAAQDLETRHSEFKELPGVWSPDNEVLRGTGTTTDKVLVLQVLPSDIAGHSMVFRISNARGLRLECLNLGSTHSDTCERTNSDWLSQVQTEWERQHVFQRERWAATARRGVGWHCPLQWLTAYAGTTRTYSAHTPSRERNRVRFSHLTGNSWYAHPTVASVERVQGLRPARFMSEFRACVAAESAQCRGETHLQHTVRALRAVGLWQEVEYVHGRDECSRVLDWPHERHTLRDRREQSEGEGVDGTCNVYPRMPRFALQLQRGGLRTAAPLTEGGACHMGRLRRIEAGAPAGALQRCVVSGGGLRCTTGSPRASTAFEFLPPHTPVLRRAPRRRRCAECSGGRERKFVNATGQTEDLRGGRPMLSTGELARLSTERVLASTVRRAVCGSSEDCPRLAEIFDTALWRRGRFMPALLNGSRLVNGRLGSRWIEPEAMGGSGRPETNDRVLWERPWVFCSNGSSCAGSIPREQWLDPKTRVQRCNSAVKTNTPPSQTKVSFCLLNSDTQELCQRVVEWRDTVQGILCQVAGTCPVSAWFYSPTAYDVNNQEFVHDSVEAYYTSLGTTCPARSTTQQDQIDSNNKALNKCAANGLERVRTMLHGMRMIKQLLLRLVYYLVSICVYMLNIFVSAFTGQLQLVKENANMMLRYCAMFLEAIVNVMQELFAAIAQLIFGGGRMEAILKLIQALCNFAETLYRDVVQAVVCDVFVAGWAGFVRGIAKAVDVLTFNSQKATTDIWRGYADALKSTGFCGMEIDMGCEDIGLDQEEETGPGTLPVSTRCWSTYVTFFGDTKQLSCTKADTCKRSITAGTLIPGTAREDSPLVVCGTCPVVGAGRKAFGCSAVTKQCTCNVADLSRTTCLSNAECLAPSSSCQYIDEEMELATGFVECSVCQSRPVCLTQEHASVGVCACGLFDTPFAQCSAEDQGQLITPPFAQACVFQANQMYARGRDFKVSFSTSMTMPCQMLSTTYCMRVLDVQGGATFWLVGVGAQGRRLLGLGQAGLGQAGLGQAGLGQAGLGEAPLASRSALCLDAAALRMTNTMRVCAEACARSQVSVQALGLAGEVPGCAFGTVEDLVHALQTQPVLISAVLTHPNLWAAMLFRHSPLYPLHKAASRAVRLLAHMAVLDNISLALAVNISATGSVRVRTTDPRVVPEAVAHALELACNTVQLLLAQAPAPAPARAPASRRLLFADVAASVEGALRELDSLRESYTTQIADIFNYRYADVDTAATRAAWLYDMGPDTPAAALRRNPCQLFTDILQLFRVAFEGLETGLRQRSLQSTPAATLAEAWRVVSPPPGQDTPPPPAGSAAAAIVNGIVAAFRALGVAPSAVYAAIEVVVRELQQSVSCDYLAVQTCSSWRVRMLHGCVIVGVWFAAWFVLCATLNLGFLATLTMPAFVVVLFSVCYGYAWTCAPMVPVCLFEDMHAAIRALLPRQMAVPDALLYTSAECQASGASPRSLCIRPCTDQPLAFTTWYSPAAWLAAEAGFEEIPALRWVPLIDRDAFELELRVRAAIAADSDEDLKNANRLCTLFSAHLLVPYVLLVVLALVMTSALMRSLAAILSSVVLTVSMLLASASTSDDE